MLLQTISTDDFNKASKAKSLNKFSIKLIRSEQVHQPERGVQAAQGRSMSLRMGKEIWFQEAGEGRAWYRVRGQRRIRKLQPNLQSPAGEVTKKSIQHFKHTLARF